MLLQRQAILNIETVLKEAGASLDNLLKVKNPDEGCALNSCSTIVESMTDALSKVNIFLTSMQDYAAMNKVYTEMVPDPKPARTCVAVAELPFGTDVSEMHLF